MAEYRVKKMEVIAPPDGAVLPRWTYNVWCEATADLEPVYVTFISDDENPVDAADICTTTLGLIDIAATMEGGCPD